ncbi:MAG: 1,6-anhydro-N-acetylmuramyl-L-alanine amidase AmpD [Halieaceae bacterium]|nr:1,6-anhydro-N-acetylmuramyl-L-alanine amidase AmpD [Halieaceae bacterium]
MYIDQGWLTDIVHKPSPNFNARPAGMSPELVVIHNISLPAGEFGTGCIEALFCNTLDCSVHDSFGDLVGLEVSAHLLIDRGGDITQFVSFDDRAWHAGVSNFNGRENCNDFSVGIELEGTDELAYTDAQYSALHQLLEVLQRHYELASDAVAGHSDIAPGRKTDPGAAFDWQRISDVLNRSV